METNPRAILGIKSGQKVGLFHTPKSWLPSFMHGDINLMLDWAEDGCDTVVYLLRKDDDAVDIMTRLEPQIKKNGRIWLGETSPSENTTADKLNGIIAAVEASTHLFHRKTVNIGPGRRAALFSPTKVKKEPEC